MRAFLLPGGERYAQKTVKALQVSRLPKPDRFYRDPAHKERYHTAAWHKIRAAQLARYPLCEMCMAEGRYVKATLVHHRVPLAEGGTNAPENLCSLCASHHTALHNKMRRDAGGSSTAGCEV